MSDSKPTLPPSSLLPTLPPALQSTSLSLLFEPSPPLLSLLSPHLSPPLPTYPSLINRLRAFLLTYNASAPKGSSEEKLLIEVLGSHPRLGEKKVESAVSRAEQRAMVAASGGEGGSEEERRKREEEAERLRRLNAEYEERFPGLRYVVFVNARPRSVIMEDMERRIERGDYEAEKVEGINAMCDIAIDRAGKLEIVDPTVATSNL